MSDNDFPTIIQDAVKNIEDYYSSSFRINPEQCTPFVIALIDQLEKINMVLTPNQQKRMKEHLLKVLQAMQNKDYVVMRDILYYEIRALLSGLSVAKIKKNKHH